MAARLLQCGVPVLFRPFGGEFLRIACICFVQPVTMSKRCFERNEGLMYATVEGRFL